MKVVNLSQEDINLLGGKIYEYLCDYKPHWILLIKTGGSYLRLPAKCDKFHVHEIGVRHRTSSKIKFIEKYIKRLPLWIRDLLRNIDRILPKSKYREVDNLNLGCYGGRLVIIDDCVDTGVTLKYVTDRLRCEYKIISINDIDGKLSDLYFYSGVICRFPWNIDYCDEVP
jgi:hypothetical protein